MEFNVLFPESVYDWVKFQIIARQFSSNSDYLCKLIMQVQKLQLLQQSITEDLASGVNEFSIANIISEVRQK